MAQERNLNHEEINSLQMGKNFIYPYDSKTDKGITYHTFVAKLTSTYSNTIKLFCSNQTVFYDFYQKFKEKINNSGLTPKMMDFNTAIEFNITRNANSVLVCGKGDLYQIMTELLADPKVSQELTGNPQFFTKINTEERTINQGTSMQAPGYY